MNKRFFSILCASLLTFNAIPTFSAKADEKLEYREQQDGYTFELWNERDIEAEMTADSEGCFRGTWGTDKSGTNAYFHAFETIDKDISFLAYEDFVRSYELDLSTNGSVLVEYSGKLNNAGDIPIEYRIVDAWSNWRPTGTQRGAVQILGTIETDGKVYDLYQESDWSMNDVGSSDGPEGYILWSVCTDSNLTTIEKNHLSSTVTVSNHFKAWAELSTLNLECPLDTFGLTIETYLSNGSVNVQKNEKIDTASEMKLVSMLQAESNLGDVNRDGKITISDVVLLSRYVNEDAVKITPQGLVNAQLNGDGQLTMDDVNRILSKIARLD